LLSQQVTSHGVKENVGAKRSLNRLQLRGFDALSSLFLSLTISERMRKGDYFLHLGFVRPLLRNKFHALESGMCFTPCTGGNTS
jgi:hypothetical protein